MTEEQALRQIQCGSQEALVWFIDHYGAYVSAIIRGILGAALTESDVEETASDVFFSLWNNAEKVRSGAARPWLSAVARNAARDRLRRAVPEQPLPEDAILVDDRTPETALTEKERTARVRLALLSLEPADREVFLRRYYYCQKLGDISQEMGLNESQRQVMETLGTTDLPAPVTSHGTTITPVAAICDKHNYYLRLRIEAPAGTTLRIPDPSEGWLQLSVLDSNTLDPDVLQVEGCDETPFYFWYAAWYDDTPGDNMLETVVWLSSHGQGQRNPDPYRPGDPIWVDFTDDTPKSVNIHNISVQNDDHEYTVLLEGDWHFDLPPAQEHPTLHIDTSGLTEESTDPGRMIYPDYFNISALSLEFEYRYDPLYVDVEYPDCVEREEKCCEVRDGWEVVLKDGSSVPLGANSGDGYHDFAYLIQPFTAPIDITQVDHIRFGDLIIPVEP